MVFYQTKLTEPKVNLDRALLMSSIGLRSSSHQTKVTQMTNDISSLQHISRTTPSGAKVIVLNTGSIIDQEAVAMLQAMHSRSIGGFMENLRVLITKGSSKFMSSFYVGYGHKSIGDCGTTTLFIEGVSMLTAKAIQDWLLYTGQESSTRYIDFKTQKFINPEGTSFGHELLEKFRSFYVHSMPLVIADLKRRFPKNDSDNDAIYTKAINARAFDILRGFLPAGASTDLAWTSSFRQITDHLMLLRHHPLKEVREVAQAIDEACQEAFPSSFGHKLYDKTESYNESWMKNHYYFKPKNPFFPDFKCSIPLLLRGLHEYREVMLTRHLKQSYQKG